MKKRLLVLKYRAQAWAVWALIVCLEYDWRGRALDYLYQLLETEVADVGRYGRSGGRYHREPRP